jgi:alkylation response protein AidB-like acyl-CoA dehydrogenase
MQQHTSDFRLRLRDWLAAHMPREDGPTRTGSDRDPARHRDLQRRLFDGGYAGLTYPAAYGGLGMTA